MKPIRDRPSAVSFTNCCAGLVAGSSFGLSRVPEAVLKFPDAGDECVKVRRGAVDEAGGHVAVVFGHSVE